MNKLTLMIKPCFVKIIIQISS